MTQTPDQQPYIISSGPPADHEPSSYGLPGTDEALAAGPPKTNLMALLSIIASASGFVLLPFVGHLGGIVMGHIARRQISRTGEGGGTLALWGLILGYVGAVLVIVVTVLIVVAIGAAISQGVSAGLQAP